MGRLLIATIAVFVVVQIGWLAGCKSGSSTDDFSTSPSPSPTPSPSPGTGGSGSGSGSGSSSATSANPLVLQVYSVYDNTEYKNQLTFDETGTTSCTATDSTPVVTCTLSIPEGRLYYSSLHFQLSNLESKCHLLFFQPYYYVRSTDAAYIPPPNDPSVPSTAIDCSDTPFPTKLQCYGGAAVPIVNGFPGYTLNIYEPDETDPNTALYREETLPSGYSKFYESNRISVDDIDASKEGSDQSLHRNDGNTADVYLANTFVHYQVYCEDAYADPQTYIINLRVKDVDSATTPLEDDFYTWKEL